MRVSIIIPVYNVKDYILDCIKSVLKLKESKLIFEIIVVNDCTPDDSIKLIEDYVKKNKIRNLEIINHEINKGLGAARNTGLLHAKHEYVWFIDSDDAIDSSTLIKSVINTNSDFDVLMLGVNQCDSKLNVVKSYLKYENKIVEDYATSFKSKIERQLDVVAWNKIIKTSLFLENENLRYTEGVLNEDEIFSLILSGTAQKVIFSEEQVYLYRIRDNSITTSTIKDNFFDSWEINFRDAYAFFKNYDTEFWVNWFLEKIQVFDRKYNFEKKQLTRLKKLTSKYYLLLPDRIWQQNWRRNELNDFFDNWFDIYKKVSRSTPLVSVIIPTYKRPENLITAIKSALEQTYKKIEIIVVNDTGNNEEYLKEYNRLLEPFVKKINYIELPINMGGASARNIGIENAKGKYITFLDDDDRYFENRISNAVSIINQYQSNEVWGCYCSYENNESKVENLENPSGDLSYDILNLNYNYFSLNTDTVLIKRELLMKQKVRFNPALRRHQDLDLFLKLFKHGIVVGFKSIDVLIRPEKTDIGNWLNNEVMHATKRVFLKSHRDSIEIFQRSIQHSIYKNQWNNVIHYYHQPDKLEKFRNFVQIANFGEVEFHEYEYLLKAPKEDSNSDNDLVNKSILLEKELERIKIDHKKASIDLKSLTETIEDLEAQKDWYENTYESLPIWWKKFGAAIRKAKVIKKQ